MDDFTNTERSQAAKVALDAYMLAKGITLQAPQSVVTDLLADLRHLCADMELLDFDRAVSSSLDHFHEERL